MVNNVTERANMKDVFNNISEVSSVAIGSALVSGCIDENALLAFAFGVAGGLFAYLTIEPAPNH